MFQLCAVGLIGKADDVPPVIDKPDFIIFAVAEFLYRADVETSALPQPQFGTQLFAVLYHRYLAKVQELLALGKQLGTLLLQVITIHDHYDCR